jgi:hypothetical protein
VRIGILLGGFFFLYKHFMQQNHKNVARKK